MTNPEIVIPDQLLKERLMKEREVCELLGISKSTLWRWVAVKRFPAPVRIGPRAVRWRQSEILAWMSSLPTVTE